MAKWLKRHLIFKRLVNVDGEIKKMGMSTKQIITALGIVLAAVVVFGAVGNPFSAAATVGDDGAIAVKTVDCGDIEDVAVFYNDQDALEAGTDPATNLVIVDPLALTLADDATTGNTLPKQSMITALAGSDDNTYFAEIVEFDSDCADAFVQPKLYNNGNVTLTFVNNDGITGNSDTNHDDVSASSTITATIKVRAPARDASARHGAVVAVEYDATNVQTVTSSLENYDGRILVTHDSNSSGTNRAMDQWSAFLYPGELMDNAQGEFTLDVEYTATAPAEDTANMNVHWLPLNYYIDADTLEIEGPALYDEDNNWMSPGWANRTYFTA